ncbi:hypothetical protein P3L10_026332 [Capsicum annuum]
MDTILAYIDAITREIAKANVGLDKLGSDMSTILERLDRVESRRNSHVSTPEALPQKINPPRPPLNDIDISQANKCPQTRDLNESLRSSSTRGTWKPISSHPGSTAKALPYQIILFNRNSTSPKPMYP